jgi:hypothetical protein
MRRPGWGPLVLAHWRYGGYVWRHKLAVYRAARRLGLTWLGLLHDWSKLRPDEWVPYALYFNGPSTGPTGAARRKAAFDAAWLRHIHRNRHHPQHWVLRQDTDGVVCLEMPDRYVLEMVADWVGAGMALKGHGWADAGPECRLWWWANRERSGYRLHPHTRAKVETILETLDFAR